MSSTALLSAGLVFLLIMGGGLTFCFGFFHSRRADYDRLIDPSGQLATSRTGLARESFELGGVLGKTLQWRVRRVQQIEPKRARLRQLRTTLANAGLGGQKSLAIFCTLQAGASGALGFGGLLLGPAIGRFWPLVALVGAIIGYVVPAYVLQKLVRKRQSRISRELPTALDLLVTSIEAGLGLIEAIKIVGRETGLQGRVLGGELSMVAAEMGAGVSLEDSLRSLGERTGVEHIKSLAALLVQSERIGGRLGPALRASAEMLTSKRRMRAEEMAQKSTIKMLIPLVLFVLPAMMIIILGPAVIQVLQVIEGAQ
jgi:tight adherence protein C